MTMDRLRRPEEGWLTLALVLVMCLILASAIDDPAWVNGRAALTDCLVWFAVAGVAIGFLGPKVGWSRWTTHVVGALFAGLLIPVVAGLSMGDPLPQAFHHTAADSVQAYLDIAWRNLEFTNKEVHYLVVLGIIVWGTSQFASYAVFGHRHPLNAVVMTGIVLVTNISSTFNNELPYLVAFTAASLFLLIEMHAFDERATWVRRRIGDPGTISSLYLRGGTVFIVAALLGSLLLMQRAASSPLAGAWDGVSSRLVEMSDTLGRLLPVGGNFRGTGAVTFGDAARIPAQWTSGDGIAFTAAIPTAAPKVLYWRAKTYNQYSVGGLGGSWSQTAVTERGVDAGQPLLAGSYDVTPPGLTTPLQIPIQTDHYLQPLLLSPGTPVAVGVPSTVRLERLAVVVRGRLDPVRHRRLHDRDPGAEPRGQADRARHDHRQQAPVRDRDLPEGHHGPVHRRPAGRDRGRGDGAAPGDPRAVAEHRSVRRREHDGRLPGGRQAVRLRHRPARQPV